MLHDGGGRKSSSKNRKKVTKRQAALQFLSSISLEGVPSSLRRDSGKGAILDVTYTTDIVSPLNTKPGLHLSLPVSPPSPLVQTTPFYTPDQNGSRATAADLVSPTWPKLQRPRAFPDSPLRSSPAVRDDYTIDSSGVRKFEITPAEPLGQLRIHTGGGATASRSPNNTLTCNHELMRASSISERNIEHPTPLTRSISDAACHSPEMNQKKIQKIKKISDRLLKDSRIVLVTQHNVPFYIYSFIPYTKGAQLQVTRPELTHRPRYPSGSAIQVAHFSSAEGIPTFLEGVELGTEYVTISYSQYLLPYSQQMAYKLFTVTSVTPPDLSPPILQTSPARAQKFITTRQTVMSPVSSDEESLDAIPQRVSNLPIYDPDTLDDPELMAGKHRTLLRFKSYLFSVTDYTKPSQLKRDINEQFHEKFPDIQLSLSKIRSIKREMRKVAIDQCGIDVVTVAQSYVYFEKLILMHMINKPNRKLCSAACLLLASKMNDVRGNDLKQLMDTITDTFRVSHRDLVAIEFPVLVALEFSLLLPDNEVLPHYKRLLHQT